MTTNQHTVVLSSVPALKLETLEKLATSHDYDLRSAFGSHDLRVSDLQLNPV